MKDVNLIPKIKCLIFVLLLINLIGCAGLNSYQNAQTLGKGKRQITGSITQGNINNIDSLSLYKLIEDKFYLAEFAFQSGFRENIDVYGKFNSSFYFTGGVKYQYTGNKKSLFANSIGAEVGIGGFFLFGAFSFHSSVVSYNSIHLKKVSFYFNPRYTYYNDGRYGYGSRNDIRNFTYNFYGYNCGFLLGKKYILGIELTQLSNNKVNFKNNHILSFAYKYNF